MSLTYDIEIRYLETGNIGTKIGDITKKAKEARTEFEGLGSSIEMGLGGAASAIGSLAKGIAGIAVAGVAATATFGTALVHMNDQLEGTQIALAAIFTSNGASSSFTGGMTLASKQIEKMRKDAADLPGEFDDLVNIFQTIAPNTFRGGLGADQTRELAAQTMAAAAIMRLPMHVAAREMSGLIEGRAGAHNILGLRMMGLAGDKAKEFNHLSEEDRLKRLSGAMKNLVTPDVLNAFQHSFTGLFSTAKQNFKTTAMLIGESLFEHTKGSLEKVNNWFDTHQGTIAVWASKIGGSLADAWDFAANAFERYWGPVTTFFSQLGTEIRSIWTAIAPLMTGVADSFRESLSNGTAVENLKGMLRLYAAIKVGGPLVGAIGGNVGKMTGVAGGEASMFGLAAGVTGSVAALVALAAAAGELSALMNKDSENHDSAVEAASGLTKAFEGLVAALNVSVTPALERFGIGATNLLSTAVRALTPDSDAVDDQAEYGAYLQEIEKLKRGGPGREDLLRAVDARHLQYIKDHPHLNPTDDVAINRNTDFGPGFGLHAFGLTDKDRPTDKKVPHSVTTIHKVEIVVQSNQDPSRIGRAVKSELAKLQKNTKSGYIPKWMGSKD